MLEWASENSRLTDGLKLSQSRISKLGDLPPLASFLLAAEPPHAQGSFAGIKAPAKETLEVLETVQADLEKIFEWNVESIDAELRAIAERMGKKLKVITAPLFVAMSGSQRSLPSSTYMALLGRSVVRQRLKVAAAVVKTMAA